MSKTKSVEIRPQGGGLSSIPSEVKNRLTDVENLTKAILVVALIALVAIIATVCGLVLDQMHFNNQTYRDQTQASNAAINNLSSQVQNLTGQVDQLKQTQQNNQASSLSSDTSQ